MEEERQNRIPTSSPTMPRRVFCGLGWNRRARAPSQCQSMLVQKGGRLPQLHDGPAGRKCGRTQTVLEEESDGLHGPLHPCLQKALTQEGIRIAQSHSLLSTKRSAVCMSKARN